MVCTLLADRSEQQPGKPTVATRPHDQQVGVTRFLDQHRSGGSLDDPAVDFDAVRVGHDLLHRGVEDDFGGVL